MLRGIIEEKKLSFRVVLMDCWYATNKLMEYIDKQGKIYYCPIKKNRLVKTNEERGYQRVESLNWEEEYKFVQLRGFPADKKVKLYLVIVSTNNTEYIVTNETKSVSRV